MRLTLSFLAGLVLGLASTLLHNAYQPLGLIVSVAGSSTALWMLGKHWGSRRYKFIALAGWLVVVFKASSLGTSGELLIEGNTTGVVFLVSGLILLIVVSAIPIPE